MASITNDGWIKLSRKILSWEWFQDRNTLQVWIYLLASASFRDGAFQGVAIRRGDVVTSYSSIAKSCHLTVRNVRTAINHLKSTGEVTSKPYRKFQVISIVNYDSYQSKVTGKLTGKRQASDRQVTPLEESKKVRSKEKKSTRPMQPWEKDIPERFRGQFPNKEAYLDFMNA